jgi:predicted phosphoribosyltransferase
MFRDREDAARRLATRLKGRPFHDPLVLAVPGGGVVVGAVLARELGADLDVVLARKLWAAGCRELVIGAVAEDGDVCLTRYGDKRAGWLAENLHDECRYQLLEILRERRVFRRLRPAAPVRGRSVIMTDDGVAAGSRLIAAVLAVRAQQPRELVVAVPVAAPGALGEVKDRADEVVCLLRPPRFEAVGQFYQDFRPVEDEQALDILRGFAPVPQAAVGVAQARREQGVPSAPCL